MFTTNHGTSIPSDKQIYNQILKMTNFSKQILFEVSAAAALHLLNKRVLNKKFKIGELVYVPDRLLKKHPYSLRDALRRIKEITNTERDYIVEMIVGETLKRHYSDLVSASVTKNQSDITLIDPFQLVDYKTKIIPDHLYPKFKLLLDKFKNQNKQKQMDLSELPIQPEQEPNSQIPLEEDECQTGSERITKAMKSNISHGTDATIRSMMQNTNPENIEFPTDLRDIKKPKSYNKKKGDNTDRKATLGYKEPIQIQETAEDNGELYKAPKQVQAKTRVKKQQIPLQEQSSNKAETWRAWQ